MSKLRPVSLAPDRRSAARSRAAAGLAIALMLPGAAFAGQPAPVAADTPAPASSTTAVANVGQDYKLGVADKIRVIVFNEPTLSGEFTVNANGSISAPLIGDVAAAGRTTSQLKSEMEARFGAGYLRDPSVSIDVLTFRPFYILGEVNKPGEYPYSSGLTVLRAVAQAEGFSRRANKRRVFIRHAGEAHEEVVPLGSDAPVLPGDTIRFGERYF